MSNMVMEVRLIKNQDGTISVVTNRSNRGEPHDTIRPPFGEPNQLEAISLALDALGYERGKWAEVPTQLEVLKNLGLADEQGFAPSDLQRGVGRLMYESFFPKGALREALHATLDLSSEQKNVARLELRYDAPEMGSLPWELLYDDESSRFLFSTPKAVLVRSVSCKNRVMPLVTAPILRVLFVKARPCSEMDDSVNLPMLTYDEDMAIEKALEKAEMEKRLELVRLPVASSTDASYSLLSEFLDDVKERHGDREYHVLHVDAHGGFGRLCDECKTLNIAPVESCRKCNGHLGSDAQGYLAFERTDKAPDWVSAQRLAALLTGSGIRLVVLTACKSSVTSNTSVFSGLAPAIISTGTPAVVAMQFTISDRAAFEFTYRFYRALCRLKPLAEAMASVHPYLFHPHPVEWYRPVLYLRTDPENQEGRLFSTDIGGQKRGAFGEETAETIDRMISCGGDLPQQREVLIALGDTCQVISEMSFFKDTHDLIQVLDNDVRPVRRKFDESDMQAAAEGVPLAKLLGNLDNLDKPISMLETHAKTEAPDSVDRGWVKVLRVAYTAIEQAMKIPSTEDSRTKFEAALMQIEMIIKVRAQEMNRAMIDRFRVLELSHLAGALRGLYFELQRNTDGIGDQELSSFGAAIEILEDLEDNLQMLLNQHDGWQQIEEDLRPWVADIRYREKTAKFKRQWRGRYKDEIMAMVPSAELIGRMCTLEEALGNCESLQDVVSALDALFGGMLRDFTGIDSALKCMCDDLKKCSARLKDKVMKL